MKLGIISDIHAQLDALELAISTLIDLGADKIVCAGDVVEKGPDGDAVVDALHRNLIPTVRGNHDDNALRHARYGAPIPGERPLEESTLDYLEGLPHWRYDEWEGVRVVMAHGIPGSNQTGVYSDYIPKAFKRWARVPRADVVILGHTHIPMTVAYGGALLVNPGSVSRTRSRDSHTCGLLSLPSCEFEWFDL